MKFDTNILKWYPFKENAEVLEIYDEETILEKLDFKIQLKQTSIKDLKWEGQYDYITLIGTYEYATTMIKGNKPYSELLKQLKKHLKPDGTILLAIDNRLGIQYFVGNKSKHYFQIFNGLESKIRNKEPNLLLKSEIEKFIKEAEYTNYKFYYPVPNYRVANSIYTDDFLPKSNHSKIVYPVSYDKNSKILYNEINVMKQICDMERFQDFANSYLVEISNGNIDNDIKFINYNNFRKDDYKLILIMKPEEVEKIAQTDLAKKHIQKIKENIENLKKLNFSIIDKVQEDRIISTVQHVEELDKKLINKIMNGEIEELYQEIENWYHYIQARLNKMKSEGKDIFEVYEIDVPQEIKEKMDFVKDGYIDLSFENIFYEDEYLFYDQEWYFENIPLEFILYRAINNLYTYNKEELEKKISKKDIINHFKLEEYVNYFDKLEEKIQKEILDEQTVMKYKNEISKVYRNLEQLDERKVKDIIELQSQNKDLELQLEKTVKEKDELEQKYMVLVTEFEKHLLWRVMRKIKNFFRKGTNNEF